MAKQSLRSQLLWMILLWCGGVLSLFIVAMILRFLLSIAGLTS